MTDFEGEGVIEASYSEKPHYIYGSFKVVRFACVWYLHFTPDKGGSLVFDNDDAAYREPPAGAGPEAEPCGRPRAHTHTSCPCTYSAGRFEMYVRSVICGALSLFAFVHSSAIAIRAQVEEPETVRVTSRLVNVDVLVTDRRTGARVEGLRREDFKVTDDSRPVEIKHFGQGPDPERPLALLLLVNVRNTTKATVPRLRAALASALSRLRAEDEVAVLDYWHGHEMVQELTRDRSKVLDALEVVASRQDEGRRRPKGYGRGKEGVGEDLAESLLAATRHARASMPNARVALVAIDDDINAPSRKTVNETADRLLEEGATVSGLIKVSGAFATGLKAMAGALGKAHYSSRAHENVAFYSRRTGGEVVNVDDDEFGEALERVVGNLAARYGLGFVPEDSRLDGRFHRLKVKVEVPERLGKAVKVEVRARQGYFARRADEGAGAPGRR